MADTMDTVAEDRSSKIHVTVIVQNRYTFDSEVVTGRQIKERANIPVGFSLHRRVRGGNEPIRDDESVELHDGDHFFSRPPATSHEGGRARAGGRGGGQPFATAQNGAARTP